MASAGHASDDEAYDEDLVVQQNIREHKEHLVKKLRVFDLINGEHTFKNIIPHKILREIEARETIEEDRAARMFLDAFLESRDQTKYSVLRDALEAPEHVIVREILYTKNFDASNLINEAMYFDGHKKMFLDNMESDEAWLDVCVEKELIFESDANRIKAQRTNYGLSRGNAMLLNAVQKSHDGLRRFLGVLWQMERKECVKEIDETFYQKMEAKDQDGWCTNEIEYDSSVYSYDNFHSNLSNSSENYNIKQCHSKGMNDLTRDSNISYQPIAHRTRSKTAAAILEHPQITQLASAVNSPVMMAPPPTIPKPFGFDTQQYGGYKVNKEPSRGRNEPCVEERQLARAKSQNYPGEKGRQLLRQTSSDVKEKLGQKREKTSSPRDKHTCSCGHVCRDEIQLQVHSKSQVCRLNARATPDVSEHSQNDRGELGFQSSQTRGYIQTTLESTGANTLKKEFNSHQERSKNLSEERDKRHVDTLTNQLEKISLQQSGARSQPHTFSGENASSQTSTKQFHQSVERTVDSEQQFRQSAERTVNSEQQFRQSAERTVNSEKQFRQSAERTVNSEQQFRQSAERTVSSDESTPIVTCKLCNSRFFKENFEQHLEKCQGQSKSDENEHDRRRLLNRQTRSLEQPHQTPRDEDPRAVSDGPDNIGARPKVYRCQRCSKSYFSSAKLTYHQTSCTGKPDRQLNATGKPDRQVNSVDKHGLLKHQSFEDRKMTARVIVNCPHCQQKFPSEDDLRSHEDRCSRFERTPAKQVQDDPSSGRPNVFRCSQCRSSFISKEALDKHKSDRHGNK